MNVVFILSAISLPANMMKIKRRISKMLQQLFQSIDLLKCVDSILEL